MDNRTQTQPVHSTDDDVARFRAANRRYSIVATFAIGLIVLLMALYTFAVTHALVTASRLPLGWIVNWLPAAFYLWALWQLRGLFKALSKEVVSQSLTVATAVGRVGWALLLGAATTLIPLVNFFTNAVSVSGSSSGGTLVVYLVPGVTLLLLGLALIALAPMLNRAIALEAEAKSLKAELGEFF
jgi:cation transport ATPase